MYGLAAERCVEEGADLYDRIGAFLADQHLSIDPVNYAFAHNVLSDYDGPVAVAVRKMIDGNVRLQSKDYADLGTAVVPGRVAQRASAARADDAAQRLVADTQAQVEGFATMMRAMQDETRGFGRDLEQSAAAIERAPSIAGIDEIARITGAMLGRIRDAEMRLDAATTETEALRAKLVEANDSARRDTLTGLPNRRAFEEAFAARSAGGGAYCLALCDIDRFKRVNDDHGHAVGDRVLSAIGQTLAEECGGHLVVRHGGEEFAILLSGASLVDAAALLDSARIAIATKRFRNRDTDQSLGQITVSIGVTAVQPSDDPDAALDRADRLLYVAKANGRDQVSAA